MPLISRMLWSLYQPSGAKAASLPTDQAPRTRSFPSQIASIKASGTTYSPKWLRPPFKYIRPTRARSRVVIFSQPNFSQPNADSRFGNQPQYFRTRILILVMCARFLLLCIQGHQAVIDTAHATVVRAVPFLGLGEFWVPRHEGRSRN